MATVFLASKSVGALREKIPSLRKTNVYAPILRWIGLGVGAAVLLVAILCFFLPVGSPVIWGGIYGCIAAGEEQTTRIFLFDPLKKKKNNNNNNKNKNETKKNQVLS